MSVVVLSSVPVLSFGIAQVATSGNAFAAGGKTTCSGGTQTVSFASPGISNQGTASASKKSTSTTSAAPSITCTGKHAGSGTVDGGSIKTKATLTCSTDSNPPSPCPAGDFVYDSVSEFLGGGGKLFKAVPTTTWTIGTTTYTAANTGSKQAPSGSTVGTCPATEGGFVLTGHLTAPASQSGKATTITACLNTDTGMNTTGNFRNDIISEVGGAKTVVIATATFDPTTSSIQFA